MEMVLTRTLPVKERERRKGRGRNSTSTEGHLGSSQAEAKFIATGLAESAALWPWGIGRHHPAELSLVTMQVWVCEEWEGQGTTVL